MCVRGFSGTGRASIIDTQDAALCPAAAQELARPGAALGVTVGPLVTSEHASAPEPPLPRGMTRL